MASCLFYLLLLPWYLLYHVPHPSALSIYASILLCIWSVWILLTNIISTILYRNNDTYTNIQNMLARVLRLNYTTRTKYEEGAYWVKENNCYDEFEFNWAKRETNFEIQIRSQVEESWNANWVFTLWLCVFAFLSLRHPIELQNYKFGPPK